MPLLATSATFAGFAEHSPAQLRELLLEEDRTRFDAAYTAALEAAKTGNLDELEAFLEHWRRYTWSQHDMGPERWHAMLDRARRIQAGERFPGAVSGEEMKRQIAERLAAGR